MTLQFAQALTRRLGVSDSHLIPCFEDAYYYLWLERTQPIDVDLRGEDLKDDDNRLRLARLLERGLDATVGYTLPLAATEAPTTTSEFLIFFGPRPLSISTRSHLVRTVSNVVSPTSHVSLIRQGHE